MKLRRSLLAVLTSVLALIGVFAVAPAAQATDNHPCQRPQVYRSGHWVQYCPMWRGNVPVYASRSSSARVVGHLVNGGSSNWFVGDYTGGSYHYGNYYNNWWAYTLSDDGGWGWVPEVFFSGGGNNETDAGLYLCNNHGAPHYNRCS